jgi:hypothetical protein
LVALALKMSLDLAGQIGQGQATNRAEAAGLKNDPVTKSLTDVSNMVDELKKQGFERLIVDTQNATELGTALKNVADNLAAKAKTKDEIAQAISQLQLARTQAQDHGWMDVATTITGDINTLKAKVPTADAVGKAVSKHKLKTDAFDLMDPLKGVRDAIHKVQAQIRQQHRDKIRADNALKHLDQVHTHEGAKLWVHSLEAAAKLIRQGTKDGLVTNAGKIRDAIHIFQKDQHQALAAGHAKLAKNLGRDIDRMKLLLGHKEDATNSKLATIAAHPPTVHVTTNVQSTIGIRSSESASSVVARYGRVVAF